MGPRVHPRFQHLGDDGEADAGGGGAESEPSDQKCGGAALPERRRPFREGAVADCDHHDTPLLGLTLHRMACKNRGWLKNVMVVHFIDLNHFLFS